MIDTLSICGFPSQNIGIHTDSRATKENILYGLKWLTSNSQTGDSLVFYYSGHGSQTADTNWNGDESEYDGKDEILCPHNLDWTEKTILRDDDLRNAFKNLKAGVNLEIILDCCHSGTATRDLMSEFELPSSPSNDVDQALTRVRYLPPPIDLTSRIRYEPELQNKPLLRTECGKEPTTIVENLNHTLWSGCKDNQKSHETQVGSLVRGVFTHSLGKILRKTKGDINRNELYRLLSAAVAKYGYDQTPQLETSTKELMDRPFF